ncbi:hypothetical protein QIS74_08428 [Colletotrichum tabaci]|uniref:Uncharacterized protein n=1 Tax=Colletotrichum tabaci TaxID=1209068 RepID=A0AAV9T8F4_9PEZI
MVPYFRPGDADAAPSWHPVSQESLLEPQAEAVTVTLYCLDDWEQLWVELKRYCLDTKNDPRRPRSKDVKLEVTAGNGTFLTVHEYVSAVHPWLMGMRERILDALGNTVGQGALWPPETKLAVTRFGYGPLWIETEDKWAYSRRKPDPPKPRVQLTMAEDMEASRKVMERMLARSAARPQYGGRGVGDLLHVKDFGARGDGAMDDTAAFQRAVDSSQERILFVVLNLQPGLHRRAAVPMGEGWGWDVSQISNNGTMILPGFGPPFGQIINILGRMCEQPQQTKTSTTIRAQTTQPSRPTEKPSARADANQNQIKCFGSGHKMGNTRLRLGIESFCSNIGSDAKDVGARGLNDRRAATGELTGGYKRRDTKTLDKNDKISFSLEVMDGCAWTFDLDECARYFKTVVDSCNCDGENGKQGGYGGNNCLK